MSGSPVGEITRFVQSIDSSLKSHPDKALVTHLQGVWLLSRALINHFQLPVDETLLKVTTLTHDIGKTAPEFQRYLLDPTIHKGPHHAAPSAWWTLALANEISLPLEEAFWGAEAVRRHHTRLEDFKPDCLDYWNSDAAVDARHQHWTQAQALLSGFKTNFASTALPQLGDLFWDLDVKPGLDKWLNLRLLYSLLIAADRLDALGIETLSLEKPPPIGTPAFSNPHSDINIWRHATGEACFESALSQIQTPGVYSLTLPTGAGKTYTGLRIASALIDKFQLASLVYVLPFISIVDQTARAARGWFPQEIIQEDHSLKHPEAEDYSNTWQQVTTLFRYWHKPLIITTLAQFWDVLFAPHANRTMNFHRLSKAVILLDEPQTLPTQYWKGLGELLGYLAAQLGTYFILMTATQPQIRSFAPQGSEIAPKTYRFPKVRHRYTICNLDTPRPLTALNELILAEGLIDSPPEGLIVLNTKKAALAVYDQVANLLGKDRDVDLLFMSAWLTPFRRKRLLKRLEILEEQKRPRILVSTQVIEAGVDLDFDWVIRDLGPFDSIVQVAGRCNRHYKRERLGKVFVTWLMDEKTNRSYAGYIYDKILLSATREVFLENLTFDERTVPDLVSKYYKKIMDRLTPSDLVEKLAEGAWGSPFELYDDQSGPQRSLIIEEDDQVASLIHELEVLPRDLVHLAQKKVLMRKLQPYVIEIPQKFKANMDLVCAQISSDGPLLQPVLGGDMLFLSNQMIAKPDGKEEYPYLYHPVKGFVPPADLQDLTMMF